MCHPFHFNWLVRVQEETMGELVTAKADVYSFAMIMWELLQSEIPYADLLFGESVPESLRKQVHLFRFL